MYLAHRTSRWIALRQHLVPENREALLERQLEPVTACHAVARPIVEAAGRTTITFGLGPVSPWHSISNNEHTDGLCNVKQIKQGNTTASQSSALFMSDNALNPLVVHVCCCLR
jgi:hypothetical protein